MRSNDLCNCSGSGSSSRSHAWAGILVPLGVFLLVSTVVAAAAVGLAVVVRPGLVSEVSDRLPAWFGRRQASGLGEAEYREFEQGTEHELLVG